MEKKILDGYELLPVAYIGDGGGYDWKDMEIYYVKSERRFFWLSGQGCSCDYLWADFPNFGSLYNGSRQDVANAIREFTKDGSQWEQREGLDAIATVMKFRVPRDK